jgi:hypothetical protein
VKISVVVVEHAAEASGSGRKPCPPNGADLRTGPLTFFENASQPPKRETSAITEATYRRVDGNSPLRLIDASPW